MESTERIYFIYKYTFPNNKVYIGQSYHGSRRFGKSSEYKGQVVYNAMIKYPDYKKEIIKDCLSPSEADDWEIHFISLYDSMNRDHGYNRESGGNKNKTFSEDTKQKMREKKIGVPLSEEHKHKLSESRKGKRQGSLNPNSKKICQYDLNGNLIKEWNSIVEASKALNIPDYSISACCQKRNKKTNNFIFRYDGEYVTKEDLDDIFNITNPNSKPVLQYSLNGEFIREWPSLKQIQRETGFEHSSIIKVCKGKQKTSYNYIWKYKEN